MAESYSLQAVPSCNAQGGVVRVQSSYTYANGDVQTTPTGDETCFLMSTGGAVIDQQPLTRNSSCEFTSVYDGPFNVEWHTESGPSGTVLAVTQVAVNCASVPSLSLDSVTTTAATQTSGGTITVQGSGGTSPLFAALSALALRQQLTPTGPNGELQTVFQNIPAGTHNGALADSTASQPTTVTFTATVAGYSVPTVRGCTDPAATNYDGSATEDDGSCTYAPVVRTAYFEVPAMQSLRFVQPGRTDRPAFDNTLLRDEHPLDFTNPGYCQQVAKSDTLVLQVLSSYASAPVLKLRVSATSAAVRTITGVRVQRGEGETAAFQVYVKPDSQAGKVRVYFNEDALPLPFAPGGRITLAGTGTSLDNTFAIQQVTEDAAAAVPYLLLLATYPSGSVRVDGTLTTTYKVQVYDTYQLVVPFNEVPEGCYQAYITATDPDFTAALAVSEPLDVAASHPGSLLISYRNFDNDFNLNYSHGLVNRLRVTGRFFHRQTGTEKNVLRNNNDELVVLSAHARRNVQLEVLQAPGYLHEAIAVAFCHDFTTIEGVHGTVAGEYAYAIVERYTLGKGTASLEVKPFLGSGNRDDLGDVDAASDGPYLIASDDLYLKTLFS